MSTEAELLYRQYLEECGMVGPTTAEHLISWVLDHERRHQTAGHRQTVVTDELELARLGMVHHRDGSWHVT